MPHDEAGERPADYPEGWAYSVCLICGKTIHAIEPTATKTLDMYLSPLLPPHMREGVKLFIEDGIKPGDFMSHVLRNDLEAACYHADGINRYRLWDIVSWLYNHAPRGCWGSPENFESWMKQKWEERKSVNAAKTKAGG